MKLLLDTHAFLWFVGGDEALSSRGRLAIEVLGMSIGHLTMLTQLPLHHRDPFDRLLVAQCLAENLTLLSGDEALDAYGIHRLW